MAVAKVIEVFAPSPTSVEDAVRSGLKKSAETIKNIKGAWINEARACHVLFREMRWSSAARSRCRVVRPWLVAKASRTAPAPCR